MSKRNRQSGRRTGPNSILPVVGKTQNGKTVVAGVYEFHETYGMPLDFLLSYLYDKDIIPDWVDMYNWAIKNNMKHDRIISKLIDPIEDSYGKEFAISVKQTLELLKKDK